MNQFDFAVEHCWVLTGARWNEYWLARRSLMTTGTPSRVEFDAARVIARDERAGDVIGFLHTHPSGSLLPSRRDIDTMRAWTSCLGHELLCLIASSDRVQAFRFEDDQCAGIAVGAAHIVGENWLVVSQQPIDSKVAVEYEQLKVRQS